MSSKKSVIVSILLFMAAVTAVSLVYLIIDFHEADESVKVFGVIQITILSATALLLVLDIKKSERYFLWGFYIMSGLLSAIQTVPALLWILFHGQPVSEGPDQAGVMAHWAYGAVHILLIAWCLINAVKYGRLQGGTNHEVPVRSLIPVFICIFTSGGLLFGVCFGNIILGLPLGVGIGLLAGIIIESRKVRKAQVNEK